ncbi:hypothetical protein B0H17DRAFT_1123511 [Mycena rosella]|uniref:Uncharacterized protein n=1 Tax=Mycena rosella TaxID=1033263 RepID=A0AAD7H1V3_MYCRO|nr:hypothetical protein B0H17DRAFT_1123511 [Mycena rosella]
MHIPVRNDCVAGGTPIPLHPDLRTGTRRKSTVHAPGPIAKPQIHRRKHGHEVPRRGPYRSGARGVNVFPDARGKGTRSGDTRYKRERLLRRRQKQRPRWRYSAAGSAFRRYTSEPQMALRRQERIQNRPKEKSRRSVFGLGKREGVAGRRLEEKADDGDE